jgi:hypothetical protein
MFRCKDRRSGGVREDADLEVTVDRIGFVVGRDEARRALHLPLPAKDILPPVGAVELPGIGVLSLAEGSGLHLAPNIKKMNPDWIETFLQKALLAIGSCGFRIKAPHAGDGGISHGIVLSAPDGSEALMGFWPGRTTLENAEKIAEGLDLASIPLRFLGSGRTPEMVMFVQPDIFEAMDFAAFRLIGIHDTIRKMEDPAHDLACRPREVRAEHAVLLERELSADPRLGEAGLVTDWVRPLLQECPSFDVSDGDVIEIDRISREACRGIRRGPFNGDVTFQTSAERCLIYSFQMGAVGKPAADRMNFKMAPAAVLDFLRCRAHAISGLTTLDRKTGEHATARALLRASGFEAWKMGRAVKEGAIPDMPAAYREDCAPGLRPFSPMFRQSFEAFLRDGRYEIGDGKEKTLALKIGYIRKEAPRELTEKGRRLQREILERDVAESPSLMVTAHLTPRRRPEGPPLYAEDPSEDDDPPAWMTIPDAVDVPAAFISGALRRVAHEAPDLIPDGMEIQVDRVEIRVRLLGSDVLRLAQAPDAAGLLVQSSSFPAESGRLIRADIALRARISSDAQGDRLILSRGGTIVAASRLASDQDSTLRLQGFQAPDGDSLPEEEIACFVNWAILDRTRKLPQAAGATLVDGISVISGTTDPRLIAILSKIDAAMRERIDRSRSEPQDPHREILDMFFEP